MKIARLDNLSKQDDLFDGGEPDVHYAKRQIIIVADNYDFETNNATDLTLATTDAERSIAIINWDKYGSQRLGCVPDLNDWKKLKQEIGLIFSAATWANLTTPAKEIASLYFVASKTERDQVYSTAIQLENGKEFHLRAVYSRTFRIKTFMSVLCNYLLKADKDDAVDEMTSNNLLYSYIDFGIEGTVEGDPEGLFDYIDARAGTTWASGGASPGLRGKEYVPIGITIEQLADKCLNKLKFDIDPS